MLYSNQSNIFYLKYPATASNNCLRNLIQIQWHLLFFVFSFDIQNMPQTHPIMLSFVPTINIHYTIVAVGIGLIIVVQVPVAVVLIPVCIPSVVGRTDPHY